MDGRVELRCSGIRQEKVKCSVHMCLETLRNKQGYMTVCEYHNMFTQLSRYAAEEVDNDAKR
jgi:hypothetical protein